MPLPVGHAARRAVLRQAPRDLPLRFADARWRLGVRLDAGRDAPGAGPGAASGADAREGIVNGTMLVDQKRGWLTESWFIDRRELTSITPAADDGVVSMHMQMRITQHMHTRAEQSVRFERSTLYPTPHAPGPSLRSPPRLPAVSAAHSRRGQSAGGGRRRDVSHGHRSHHRARARRRRLRGRHLSLRPPAESGDPARVHAVRAAGAGAAGRDDRARRRQPRLAALGRDGRDPAAFAQLGLHVVDREARRLSFPDRDLSVLAVPDVPGLVRRRSRPIRTRASTCSCCTARFRACCPTVRCRAIAPRSRSRRPSLHASRWDYVALGHYHVYREVAPNAFYSGSIDYTSVEHVGRAVRGARRRLRRQGIHRARPRHRRAHVSRAAAVAAAHRPAADQRARTDGRRDRRAHSRRGRVVRSRRHRRQDRPPDRARRAATHRARARSQGDPRLQAARAELPSRPPPPGRLRLHAAGAPGRRPSLNEIVREKLRMRPLDADVDRDALVDRAIAYLDEAQAMALPSGAARRDLDAPQQPASQQLPAARRYPDRFRDRASRASSARTARASRRSSRRSPGRCTACRRRAARATRFARTAPRRARRSRSSSTSSSAAIATSSRAG